MIKSLNFLFPFFSLYFLVIEESGEGIESKK